MSISDASNLAFPAFIDFTDSTFTSLTATPILATAVGTYAIELVITDGFAFNTYPLNIIVTAAIITSPGIIETNIFISNIGPPLFTE